MPSADDSTKYGNIGTMETMESRKKGRICQVIGCANYATHPDDAITERPIRFHSFPRDLKRKVMISNMLQIVFNKNHDEASISSQHFFSSNFKEELYF